MKTKPKPIEILDEETGRLWQVPRKRVQSVFADVSERWVANVLVPEEVCRDLVKAPFLEPVPVRGRYVLSLCAIFMRSAAPDWAPLKIGPASRNCALRVACRDVRDGSDAVWVDHRYSDSVLVEAPSKLGFPAVHAKLEVDLDRDFYGRRKVEMRTKDHLVDLRLIEYPDLKRLRSDVFESALEFENYFGAGVRSYGPGATKHAVTIVDLHKLRGNHFEAMGRYFGCLYTPMGNWTVDSVYRTRNGLYEWRYEGNVAY